MVLFWRAWTAASSRTVDHVELLAGTSMRAWKGELDRALWRLCFMENLYSYKMVHDDRFAPNPFWEHLTLAVCKPYFRLNVRIGDWISGWTSKSLRGASTEVGKERLLYLARVSEKLTFE